MKIFAVYSTVQFTEVPTWLVDFRKKYDEPWEAHTTLAQPCFIEEEKIGEIKEILHALFSQAVREGISPVHLFFTTFVEDTDADGMTCIMMRTTSAELDTLQRRIITALRAYRHFVEPAQEGYEKNFIPHITIARNLTIDTLACARQELPDHGVCEGSISDVTLSLVEGGLSPEATMRMQERTVFSL